MAELRKFYKHSSSYLLGRFLLMLVGFVSFPIFTRLFSVSEYGIISLVTSTMMIVTIIGKFGMQNSVQRFHKEHADLGFHEFQRYYSSVFFGTAALCVGLTALFVGVIAFLPNTWLSPWMKVAYYIVACLVLVRPIRSMVANLWQVEGNTIAFNAQEVLIRAFTIPAVLGLFFLWQRSLISFFVGTIGAELVVMTVSIYSVFRRKLLSVRNVDLSFLWAALSFGVPLMWAELAYLVLDMGDRFLIQRYLGSESLGFYSAAYGIAGYIPEVLMIPINLALFPIVMQLWNDKGPEETVQFLSKGFQQYMFGAIGLLCVVYLTAENVVVLLASRKFQQAHTLLPLLVGGLLLYSVHVFFRPALLIHKKSMLMAKVFVLSAVLNVALNMFLLPRMGTLGAAWATFLSYAACLALVATASWRALPLKVDFLSLGKCAGAALITWLLVSRIEIDNTLLSLVVRTAAATLLYVGILWLGDGNVRKTLRRAVELGRQFVTKAEVQPRLAQAVHAGPPEG